MPVGAVEGTICPYRQTKATGKGNYGYCCYTSCTNQGNKGKQCCDCGSGGSSRRTSPGKTAPGKPTRKTGTKKPRLPGGSDEHGCSGSTNPPTKWNPRTRKCECVGPNCPKKPVVATATVQPRPGPKGKCTLCGLNGKCTANFCYSNGLKAQKRGGGSEAKSWCNKRNAEGCGCNWVAERRAYGPYSQTRKDKGNYGYCCYSKCTSTGNKGNQCCSGGGVTPPSKTTPAPITAVPVTLAPGDRGHNT